MIQVFRLGVLSELSKIFSDHFMRFCVKFESCVLARAGVTNKEIHAIIRKHVARFVPTLRVSRSASLIHGIEDTSGGSPAPIPGSISGNVGAGDMVIDDDGTQEAGISSTR